MVRLLVDDSGQKRSFRLGEGILTVGRGPAAKLKLAAADVAELHLELEYRGGVVKLRPRHAASPVRIAGLAISSGEVTVPLGQPIQVGAATLVLQDEAAAMPAAPAALPKRSPLAAQAVPAPAARPDGSQSGAERARSFERAAEEAQRQRIEPLVQRTRSGAPPRGAPPALKIGLTLAGLAVVVVIVRWGLQSTAEAVSDPTGAALQTARDYLKQGEQILAAESLARAKAESGHTTEHELEIARLAKELAAAGAASDLALRNNAGSQFLDSQLKSYEAKYLAKNAEAPKVRVYLERCREFLRRWPAHPEVEWVRRQQARFASLVDLDSPPNLADVEWKVHCLQAKPRNYQEIFALLDGFLERCSPEDAAVARALRDEQVSERKAYHADRIQEAKFEFQQKDNPNMAVWWLVHGTIWMADEAMENEAAEILLKMPDAVGHLRGYQSKYPEKYDALLENSLVREFARREKML